MSEQRENRRVRMTKRLMKDALMELLEQEDALISKYNAEQSTVNEVSYTYKGKTYTLQDLYDELSSKDSVSWCSFK